VLSLKLTLGSPKVCSDSSPPLARIADKRRPG
jgi:hypothetical protein